MRSPVAIKFSMCPSVENVCPPLIYGNAASMSSTADIGFKSHDEVFERIWHCES